MNDTEHELSTTTMFLHWIIALTIIGMLIFGSYVEELPGGPEKSGLLQIHKATGVIVFLLATLRLIYRVASGFPPHVSGARYKNIEIMAAKATHWVLLLGSVLMPVSGMAMSLAGGHPISLFGLLTIPGLGEPAKELAEMASEAHETLATILMAAIALHVVGALKHHIMDKDGTLWRILGKNI